MGSRAFAAPGNPGKRRVVFRREAVFEHRKEIAGQALQPEQHRHRQRRRPPAPPPRRAQIRRHGPRTVTSATTASRPITTSSGTVIIIFSWPDRSAISQIQPKTTSPAAINTHTAARSARPTKPRKRHAGRSTSLRPGSTGEGDEHAAGQAASQFADLRNLLDRHQRRQRRDDVQVHHAAHEQQEHQRPAAAHAVDAVRQRPCEAPRASRDASAGTGTRSAIGTAEGTCA